MGKKLIGRYEIQSELGRGGFGQVFRAFDPVVGRQVAVKTLLATDDPDLLTRFRNEAGATGKLRHQNIVIIYDFGEHDGAPYLVMELMEGHDLEQEIAGGSRMSMLEKVVAISQMAAGLHHAHSHGIVHRDVKPANIMLTSGNRVKIMDFGIALLSQATAARITPQGSILGTLPFMSPEQFQGAASDFLTDIFALGITCYKFLTGIHPFQAPELAGLMGNIVSKTPEPIRVLNPDCPEALQNVVSRLLAKEREERYQSLEDTLFDLEPISVEMRGNRIVELVKRARSLIESDRLDEAYTNVREALDLEPSFMPARELRERLQHLIKDKSIGPKVAALIATGRRFLELHVYDEAILKFESALKLDRSNNDVQLLIGETRAAWEQRLRADRLLKDAEQAFEQGDLLLAQRMVRDALAAFPEHPGASELQNKVRLENERRSREEKFREALNRAKSLLRIESFDAAIEVLQDLDKSCPGSTDVHGCLEYAFAQREEQIRRQRLLRGTDQVRKLLRDRRFEDASSLVASLHVDFPGSIELATLESYLAEELKVRAETTAIAAKSSAARELLSKDLLTDAIGSLRAGLEEHPGASVLRELLQEAESAKAEKDRSAALAQTVIDVNSLFARESFEQALERIAVFTSTFGKSAAIDPLRLRAEEALDKLKRVAAVRKLVLEAQGLMDEGRPGTASNVLQRATVLYPGEAEISRLLRLAESQVCQQQKAKEISAIVAEAESLTRGGLFEEAFELLERARKNHPQETPLLRCREAAIAAQNAFARQAHIAATIEAASRLAAEKKFQSGLDLLDSVSPDMESDQRIADLRKQLRAHLDAARRQEALRRTLEEAERLIEVGDLLSATRILGGLKGGRSNPEVTRLTALAEERRQQLALASEIDGLVAQIKALRSNDRFEEAEKRAHSGLTRFPTSSEIQKEYELARAARTLFEQASSTIEIASTFAESGQFARALETLDMAPDEIRRKPAIVKLRSSVQAKKAVAAIIAQADKRRVEGDYSGALEVLTAGLVQHSGSAELAAHLQRAKKNLLEAQADLAREALVGQVQSLLDRNPERALDLITEGIERFGGSNLLNDVKKRAEAAIAREKCDRDIVDIQNKAQSFLRAGDYEKAIQSIEKNSFAVLALADLLSSARKLRSRKLHGDLLVEAHQLCAQSRFEDAMATVQRAIVQHGGSPESNDLHMRLQAELEEQKVRKTRERSLERLRLLDKQLSDGYSRFFLAQRAAIEANELRSGYSSDQDFIELEARIHEKTKTAAADRRKFRNRAFQFLFCCIVAGLAFILWGYPLRNKALIHMGVRTDPNGASVIFGERTCVTPHCFFAIPPGHYRVQANLEGYEPVQQEFEATRDNEGYVMELILRVKKTRSSATAALPQPTRAQTSGLQTSGSTTLPSSPKLDARPESKLNKVFGPDTMELPRPTLSRDNHSGSPPIQLSPRAPTTVVPAPPTQRADNNAIPSSSAKSAIPETDGSKTRANAQPASTASTPELKNANTVYYGAVSGEVIWKGTLDDGEQLVLAPSGPTSGKIVNSFNGGIPEGAQFFNVKAKADGAEIKAEALSSSRIRVTNTTGHLVGSVIVSWKAK